MINPICRRPGGRAYPTTCLSALVKKKIRFPSLVVSANKIPDKSNIVGLLGFNAQHQPGLVGAVFALFAIARDAGADQVFPGAFAALDTRYDMVDRQLAALASAILALVVVPLEDIALRKH